MQSITFVTGNIGKVEEVSRFLGVPVMHEALDITEIQSLSSEEIVRDKAERAFKQLNRPVLIEDVSLEVPSLNNLPGPFIKWFEQALGNEGLCRAVDGKDRSCVTRVTYGYHDGKEVHIVDGEMRGTIAEHPKGERSFGWAPIVIPEGLDKTYAELSDEEQEEVAMRVKALKKLRTLLGEG